MTMRHPSGALLRIAFRAAQPAWIDISAQTHHGFMQFVREIERI
jgi:hypothetical protein